MGQPLFRNWQPLSAASITDKQLLRPSEVTVPDCTSVCSTCALKEVKTTLGTFPHLGCSLTIQSSLLNSIQAESEDSACKSPTLLASKSARMNESPFTPVVSSGSQGGSESVLSDIRRAGLPLLGITKLLHLRSHSQLQLHPQAREGCSGWPVMPLHAEQTRI